MLQTPKVVQVPHSLKGLQALEEGGHRGVRLKPCCCYSVHEKTLTLVFSLVVIARLIRDPVFIRVLPDATVISSVAGAGVGTVDDVLH